MKLPNDAQFCQFSKYKILIQDTCPECKSKSVDYEPDWKAESLEFRCAECGNEWSEG